MEPETAAAVFGLALYALILGPPIAQILRRAGLNRWWMLLAFVPLANIAGLWAFAFGPWPAETAMRQPQPDWSDSDKERFKKLLDQRGAA